MIEQPPFKLLTCHETLDDKPVLFRILPVTLYGAKTQVNTFALLDEGSSVTMIESALAVKFNLMGPSSNLNVQWFGHQTATVSSQRVTLGISGTSHQRFQLHNVRTVRDMNLPMQTVKISSIDDRHGHLRGLPICEYRNAVPQILIGLDNCHLGVAAQNADTRLEKIIEKFHETESFGVKPTNLSMESDEDIRANHLLQTTTARVGDRF